MIKLIIRKTYLYSIWRFLNKKRFEKLQIKEWTINGKQIPPPHIVKFYTIKEKQKINNAKILIETGTYKGAMIKSCKKLFKNIYSIELDKNLYKEAVDKFQKFPKIKILNGDSGLELKKLLLEIKSPCLFWLDGHYSGGITAKGDIETPIVAELEAILTHNIKNHVILIDDARLFNGENDYPTIKELTAFIYERNNFLKICIENDLIIIL